jgi:hypothetical protein
VDAAIADLGFVPNPMARGLAGGRRLSIGVVTQAIDSPFYGGALHRDAAGPPGGRHHRARTLKASALWYRELLSAWRAGKAI